MKLILRVDDVGWDVDYQGNKVQDVGLAYFEKWRDAAGLCSAPVYYGAIPEMICHPELDWFKQNLSGYEELSVHGWDHKRYTVVTESQMVKSADRYRSGTNSRCRSYIPPFNEYLSDTMRDWAKAELVRSNVAFFFGGFHGEHHKYGHLISRQQGCAHLPAFRPLYDHTEPLLRNLDKWLDIQAPLVVTLHATWGRNNLPLVGELIKRIRPHLITLDEALLVASKGQPELAFLTAPHYLAYKYVLDQGFQIGSNVLDFGARYSALPSLLTFNGARVTAYDRDPKLHAYQKDLSNVYSIPTIRTSNNLEDVPAPFDAITACWAIQHNNESEIPVLAKQLGSMLKPGGRLIIVSSHTPGSSHYQTNREDPQFVLNWEDHKRLIAEPSGLKVHNHRFFHYRHSSTEGDYCEEAEANAVCYTLTQGSAFTTISAV